ncbi:hypothetical protein FB567DRAFT_611949 [Paraphoma chrysanthemicola]|uniref:Uncharacterized protein n=1 Tax=Paraphoma chrysanthemicola TaxID=798071 RepID=A0A8K0QWX4_9PLEO|nr:hypothetical protein FB567DRAFT_611949 [Paraphoma chrysanthemicola]
MLTTIRFPTHLYRTATSTRWPGASSNAIHFLFAALLIATAQFAIILALGVKLLRLDSKAQCWVEAQQGWEWVGFPVVYVTSSHRPQGKLWMGENTSKIGIIYASILSPLITLLFLGSMLRLHFRRDGITNRQGISCAFWIMLLLVVGVIQDAWLGPDSSFGRRSETDRYCHILPSDFAVLKKKHSQRVGLGVGSEVLSGLAALCMILYLSLAIIAARRNALMASKSSVRLENLTSTSTSAPSSHPTSPQPHPSLPAPSYNPLHPRNPTGRHTPTGGSSPISNLSPYPLDHPLSQPDSAQPAAEGQVGITIEREVRVESARRSSVGWNDDEEGGVHLRSEQRVWTPLAGEVRDGYSVSVESGGENGEDGDDMKEEQARKDSKN